MNFTRINYRIDNQIAYVELAREQQHNAVDMAMFSDLLKVIKLISTDKSLRAVIVSGQGEDFCSGIDVKSMFSHRGNALKLLFKWLPWHANSAQKVSTMWRQLNIPVIFALHGRCWGAGLQIALGGDFRIATPNCSLSIMEGRWGLIPDMGGTLALRELMPLDKAKKLAMTAQTINGEQAKTYGLVTEISSDVHASALRLAQEIIHNSPDSVAACKKLYNNSWWSSSGMALARETYYQIKVLLTPNYRIKSYNETHDKKQQKPFRNRKNW